MSEAHEDALTPGSQVNGYRIDALLGSGGFAITYKATKLGLGLMVALKEYFPSTLARRSSGGTVRPASGTSNSAKQSPSELFAAGLAEFEREGQRLAAIKHTHIVSVVDFFHAQNTAYLALAFESEHNLQQQYDQGRRFEETTLKRMAEQLLSALIELHQPRSASHGAEPKVLLHRDIKPANIVLRANGDAVLIDFGAARNEVGKLTRDITCMVSEGYSPPEQYGSGKAQGPWSDLYALGGSFYQLTTGLPPVSSLDRKSAMDDGEADPLAPASLLGVQRFSPGWLRWIDSLLQLERSKRPQSAAAALAELHRLTGSVGTQQPTERKPNPFPDAKVDSRSGKSTAPSSLPISNRLAGLGMIFFGCFFSYLMGLWCFPVFLKMILTYREWALNVGYDGVFSLIDPAMFGMMLGMTLGPLWISWYGFWLVILNIDIDDSKYIKITIWSWIAFLSAGFTSRDFRNAVSEIAFTIYPFLDDFFGISRFIT